MQRTMSFDDIVEAEAKLIAKEFLESELNKLNLPLPKDPDRHIDVLISMNPDIRIQARKRVEAKKDTYKRALTSIGADNDPTKPTKPNLTLDF